MTDRLVCEGFQWVGQPLTHCDGCGNPYWEHTHESRWRPTAGAFDPSGFVLVPIVPEQAEAVRRKWGP